MGVVDSIAGCGVFYTVSGGHAQVPVAFGSLTLFFFFFFFKVIILVHDDRVEAYVFCYRIKLIALFF